MDVNTDASDKPTSRAAATGGACDTQQIEQWLKDLPANWDDGIAAARELVKAHPVAAVVSVFAIGLILGRITGPRS